MEPTPGQLLKEARLRRGVSQARLATRAGTTQSAISRIEGDRVSPTIGTLRSLLHLLGEDLELSTEVADWGVDRSMMRANLALSTEHRVRRGLQFADFVRRNRGAAKAAA